MLVLLLALAPAASPALAASDPAAREETPPDPEPVEVDDATRNSGSADPAEATPESADPDKPAPEPGPTTDGQDAPDSGSAAPGKAMEEPDESPAPPRPLTQSELLREIEILQRDFEELILRVGENEPTDKQRRQLHDLAVKLSDDRRQLDSVKDIDEAQAQGEGLKARWVRLRQATQDITRYDVKNGIFRIQLGGRFQLDATAGTESEALQSQAGGIEDSVDFRRARIFAIGRLLRRYDFRFEYDFAVDGGPKDVYFEGVKFTKYVKWRLGQFREPFSLGRQTSSFDHGFLERALPVQALTPGRNPGIMFRHVESNSRLFWAVSVTTAGKTTDDNRTNARVMYTGRLTGLALYRNQGKSLLHLGASYSLRSPKDDTSRLEARPEARFAPFFVDTGDFSTKSVTLAGVEVAMVHGPYWAQGEWVGWDSRASDGTDPSFDGAYMEMGWFLTGESRFYRTEDGKFSRVTPNRLFKRGNPFRHGSDGGALEFTARYSTLDLNSGPVSGGEIRDFSVGMNWYLNQTSRVMLNAIRSDVRDVGTANLLLLRLQFNP